MARDHRLVSLEKLGHLVERQPDRLPLEADFDPRGTILGLKQDEFTGIQRCRCGQVVGHDLVSVRLPFRSGGSGAGSSRTVWRIV